MLYVHSDTTTTCGMYNLALSVSQLGHVIRKNTKGGASRGVASGLESTWGVVFEPSYSFHIFDEQSSSSLAKALQTLKDVPIILAQQSILAQLNLFFCRNLGGCLVKMFAIAHTLLECLLDTTFC